MNEPGEPRFERLAVSLKPEAMQRLTALRAHFEATTGERFSLSKVVRRAIDSLSDKEGLQ